MLNSSSHPRAVSHPLLVAPMLTATVMGRWWLANISGTHPLHWSSYRVVVRYHTNNCVTVCKLSLALYLSSPFFLLRHIHTHTHTHTHTQPFTACCSAGLHHSASLLCQWHSWVLQPLITLPPTPLLLSLLCPSSWILCVPCFLISPPSFGFCSYIAASVRKCVCCICVSLRLLFQA